MARSEVTALATAVALRRVMKAYAGKQEQGEKQEDKPSLKIAYWEAGGVFGTADNVSEAGRKAGTWAAVRRAQNRGLVQGYNQRVFSADNMEQVQGRANRARPNFAALARMLQESGAYNDGSY